MSERVHKQAGRSGAAPTTALCGAVGLTRSTYYRLRARGGKPVDRDRQARRAVARVCRKWTAYGCRRVSRELRSQGTPVGRERVRRLMREQRLTVRPKRRWVCATQSDHGHKVWPNLARDFKPTGLDQLWVADITYIALARGFVYLAVVPDALSRRVIGWALGATLTIQALKMALATRTVGPGLIHHSDRGVQYACGDTVVLLQGPASPSR